MNGVKKIDGKNAVLIVNNDSMSVTYKNAFGYLIGNASKRIEFTFDDIDEIEYKKPGITMNGFILIVLKNGDMHKIVLNKLDEYSLELTDELIKDLEVKLNMEIDGIPNEVEEEKKDEEEIERKSVITNDVLVAHFSKKKDENEKNTDNKTKDQIKKDAIKVTEKAIKYAYVPIAVVKPKSKKEIEKDKIREELKLKVEEKKKENENTIKDNNNEKKSQLIIKGNQIIDDAVVIPTIPQRPKVFVREMPKDKENVNPTIKRIVTKENSPKEEVKEEPKQEVKLEVKSEEINNKVAATTPKEKGKEKEKEKKHVLPDIFKKINLTVSKDKRKNEEFSKVEEKKIRVGEVEIDTKGKEKTSVPIDVTIRPLKKEELEELEKKKNDVIIDELKYKLYVIESELHELTFQLLILKKYYDTSYDIEEVNRIIKQIEDLIKVLEAIKQELINKMDGKDYVANKALDVTGDDIVNIDDFKTIYVKALDRINELEAELNTVKEKTNERKKEIEITDKEFEEDANKLKEKKELVDKYDDFIARTRTYTEILNYHVGKDKISTTEYYIKNVKSLRNDTKLLATLSAVSLATPGINGPATAIITTATGLAAMRDAIVPKESVRVTKETITPIDYSKEIRRSFKDVNEASQYITSAKKDIADIKKEINDKYKNFPEYKDILEEFDKLEVEIDRQEKVLNTVIYTLNNSYAINKDQKVLILEKEDEN